MISFLPLNRILLPQAVQPPDAREYQAIGQTGADRIGGCLGLP
jgi:hypothetical protein